MLPAYLTQDTQTAKKMNNCTSIPLTFVVQQDIKLFRLLSDLSDDVNWGTREDVALKLGAYRNPFALHGLLRVLPDEAFWMLRCTIIQALEMIGDRIAIPALRDVAKNDSFQVVRSYAAKAIERLS